MAIRYLSGVNIDSNTLFVDDANNRVGIGTASPAYPLDIVGFANSSSGFRVTDGTIDNRVSWSSGNVGFFGTVSNHPIAFNTNLTERMRITSAGNVGIGVTNPDSYNAGGNQLVIGGGAFRGLTIAGTTEGNIYFADGTNGTETYRGSIGYNHTSDYLYFYSAANERLRITSAGNVGIGTGSPVSPLDVNGIISSRGIFIAQNSGTYNVLYNASNSVSMYLGGSSDPGNYYDNTTHYFRSSGGSSTYAVINYLGNVGIGTTSPSQKLHVNGVIEAGPSSVVGGPMIYQSYASPNYIGSIGSEYSSGAMLIGYGATGKNGASGYVSTFANFNGIRGLIKLQNGEFSILSSISAVQTAIGGDLTMTTNFIVTNAGNVGIGTTAPTSKLHVASGRIEIDNGQSLSSRTSGGGNLFPLIQMSSNEITVGGWEGSHMSNLNLRGGNGAVLADFSQGNASFFAVRGVAGATPNEYMRVTSTGNVGIGTTSPLARLHTVASGTYSTSTFNGSIVVESAIPADGAYGAGIILTAGRGALANGGAAISSFYDTGDNDRAGLAFFYHNATFADPRTEGFRLTAQGNVGIGTTSPAQKLDVAGGDIILSSNATYIRSKDASGNTPRMFGINPSNDTYIGPIDPYAGGAVFYGVSANVSSQTFYTGASARLHINSAGNVGIGTTSPAAKFQVTDASSSITLQNYLNGAAIFLDGVNGDFIGGDYFHILADGSSYLGVGGYAGGATPLNVSNAGNVGIGTTSPSALLHVATASTTGTTSMLLLSRASGYGHTLFEQIYDSTYFTAGKTLTLKNDAGTAFAHFAGNNAGTRTDLLIPTGNVGIGTNAPITELEILSSSYDGITMSRTAQSGGTYIQGRSHDTSNVLRTTGRIVFGATAAASAADGFITFNTYSANTENERMRITSAGNVGIGTTSPSNKLTIVSSAQNSGLSILDFNGAAGWGGGINLGVSGLSLETQGKIYTSLTNSGPGTVAGDMRFQTANSGALSDKMTITAAGNVGIGTTSPGEKLVVSNGGAAGFEWVPLTGRWYRYNRSTSAYGGIYTEASEHTWSIGTSEKMRLNASGNVGIGTTSPVAALHVQSSATKLFLSNTDFNTSTSTGSGLILHTGASSGNTYGQIYAFQSGNTSYANLVVPGGNVGIGTTSPSEKLEVSGSAAGDFAALSLTNTNQSGTADASTISFKLGRTADSFLFTIPAIKFVKEQQWTGTPSTIDGALTFSTILDESVGERMRITSAGNVGIGTTSPAGKLSVVGDGTEYSNIVLRHSTNQEHLIYASTNVQYNLIGSSTPTWVWGQQGSTERMRLNNTGLGIGTDSPSQKLHVTGNVRVTGAYYDSNNEAGTSGQVLTSTGTGTDWKSLAEITGVDGTGTANYIAKWSDTDTITNSQIRDDGTTVGVGQAPSAAKMSVNGALNVGGRYLYNNFQPSLDTTGVAVAGLSASTNGDSAFFTFEAGASGGQYQRIVWSCYNAAGTWNVVKVIDEGTNAFDVVASASSGATITFTWKSRSGILYFTPRLIITGVGSINTSYL